LSTSFSCFAFTSSITFSSSWTYMKHCSQTRIFCYMRDHQNVTGLRTLRIMFHAICTLLPPHDTHPTLSTTRQGHKRNCFIVCWWRSSTKLITILAEKLLTSKICLTMEVHVILYRDLHEKNFCHFTFW
jgi:hypothetical protein